MASLTGTISIQDLPPHRGIIASLAFFAVQSAESPVPFGGDPPAKEVTDDEKVFDKVDLNSESTRTSFEHSFSVERPAGYYYIQLRVILFRLHSGKVFAQAEQFFFGRRPLQIGDYQTGHVTFPVIWPTTPLESLHSYGTIKPQRKRPWWRFW